MTAKGKSSKKGKKRPQAVVQKDQPAPSRWKNWWIRGAFTFLMLVAFAGITALGPLALCVLILLLQVKCYQEVIAIAFKAWPKELPWFRSLHWYWIAAANYFLIGERFDMLLYREFADNPTIIWMLTHHRFISFSLYIIGFCTFVLSLRKGFYKYQFKQLAWTHLSLLVVASASQLIMRSIYNGLIWFLVPVCAVVCNDVMAYMFGFFWGKTQLISLSPKKTWEGFIGAFWATVVWSIGFTYVLVQFPVMLCPSESIASYGNTECENWPIFNPKSFQLPLAVSTFIGHVGIESTEIVFIPAIFHAILISIFASLIAPFGGFFASGLKRAFQTKDFDNLIPGHGGVTDRFDCQMVMAFFMFVYYSTFIRPYDVDKVLRGLFSLTVDDQMHVFNELHEHLLAQGIRT
eukprot:m.103453 g.103453  ORF g.103453 m.103453 type:complete len:405 (+) comp9096_c3_seq1:650-1864(+)